MRPAAPMLTLLGAAFLVPASASAQEGAIAGRVLDVAGDPLPGVTVEVLGAAQSEARLEVTDREGRYRIDDLLPGAYAVRFTLPGFQWVVGDRDVDVGIVDVGAGRVATVDAEMTIGSLTDIWLLRVRPIAHGTWRNGTSRHGATTRRARRNTTCCPTGSRTDTWQS